MFHLVTVEGVQALLLRHALALVAEDHRIAVEGDAQLLAMRRRPLTPVASSGRASWDRDGGIVAAATPAASA